MKKVLYFEGLGWDKSETSGEVGNCRIATAFTLKNGKKVFLQATSWKPDKTIVKAYNDKVKAYNDKVKTFSQMKKLKYDKCYLFIDSLHYITDDIINDGVWKGFNIDDENENRIKFNNDWSREWTNADLLAFVNGLGADFDEVKCLPDLAGYQVFKSGVSKPQENGNTKNYNYGDEFDYNAEQTERRIAKYKELYEKEKKLKDEEFPCVSFYVDSLNPDFCIFKRYDGTPEIKYYIPKEV